MNDTTVSEELLALLVCPKCKGELTRELDPLALVCPSDRLRYPIREGIPIMLVDEAEPLS
jgi:uncharacterized protein YbaR (Trm112 family)